VPCFIPLPCAACVCTHSACTTCSHMRMQGFTFILHFAAALSVCRHTDGQLCGFLGVSARHAPRIYGPTRFRILRPAARPRPRPAGCAPTFHTIFKVLNAWVAAWVCAGQCLAPIVVGGMWMAAGCVRVSRPCCMPAPLPALYIHCIHMKMFLGPVWALWALCDARERADRTHDVPHCGLHALSAFRHGLIPIPTHMKGKKIRV
jgi:hypothetical protein